MKAQVDLLTSAKQGNLQALEALMNRPLEPQGIVISLCSNNRCLTVTAEAPVNPPSKHSLISFIKQGLANIMPTGIYSVMVHGKVQGLSSIAWYQHFSLRHEPETFVTPEQMEHLSSSKLLPHSVAEPAAKMNGRSSFSTKSIPHFRQFLWANSLMLGALLGANVMGWFMPQRVAKTPWEYHILTVEDDNFAAAMENMGKHGWELSSARRAIASESDSEYSLYELILKRPK